MRRAAFIDGRANHETAKAFGVDIDFRKLSEYLGTRAHLVRACYYTIVREDEDFVSIRPLLDWLTYNGFHVVSRKLRALEREGGTVYRGSMDVSIAVDMVTAARDWRLDELWLFAGSAEYVPAVEACQRLGLRVVVCSGLKQVTTVADELRRGADEFVDFGDLLPVIGRERAAVLVERGNRQAAGSV